jgi:hypothetical protein
MAKALVTIADPPHEGQATALRPACFCDTTASFNMTKHDTLIPMWPANTGNQDVLALVASRESSTQPSTGSG